MRRLLLAAVTAFAATSPALAADPLAAKAKAILDAHCHRCHGKDGAIEGGFNYVLDFAKLADRKKVIAGNAAGSLVVKRIVAGTMPPPGEKPRVSDADLATLKQWIDAGAGAEVVAPQRTAISAADVTQLVLADLETVDRRARRFVRYFSLTHLHNAGLGDDELQTYRNALSKLLNSLSWHPKVRTPEPVDAAKTVLRIDLRWYLWDATLWNRMLNDYPYGLITDSGSARAMTVGTATKVPVVRADWFVATASRAPLYYDLLQLPGNLGDLEKQLRVDSALNIQQERVMRAAFNGSGIARSNRVLERHDALNGPYWRSYDFDEVPQNLVDRTAPQPADRRNVFAFPLGPGQAENSFVHFGGEMIFALPNGLHAYFIVNAANARLDKAPQAIVSDPRRPDRAVEAGVSCMSCHVTGILPKADQVRDHVEKNAKAFTRLEIDQIKALYPPKDKTLAAMDEDMKNYAAAAAKTGAKVARTEAVSTITLKYEADVDLIAASAEVGLTADAFRARIDASEPLRQSLGALRAGGGTVARPVWVQAFGDLARDLQLGELFRGNVNGAALTDNTGELDPLEAQGNVANAVALSANGKLALIGAADRSVRVWDVEGGRDLKRLVGHTATVWAVAFSGDGKKAVSGGVDGTVRIWDIDTGTELKKLDGHAAMVSAVAFSGDGTKVISGGFDGAVVWWNADTGKEIHRLEGDTKYVHAIAMPPTAKLAAVAADRNVILWDFSTGDVLKTWDAHAGAVTAIRFAEGGSLLLSGGDDAAVKLWSPTDGKLVAELKGHAAGIRDLAVKPGGRGVLSASADGTVKLWDVAAAKDVATFKKHGKAVVAAGFLPSGVKTLSVDRELGVLIWDVAKFLTGSPALPTLSKPPPDAIPKAKE